MKKVEIKLKREQWRDGGKWEFTLRGEQKFVGCERVSFYAQDDEDVVSLINMDEIEDITSDIFPPIEYLPDSDQFRTHKLKKIPFSNMDMIISKKQEGDFVLFKVVFCWVSEANPLYRIKMAELFNPINTEK